MKKGFVIQYSLLFIMIFSMIIALVSINLSSYNYQRKNKLTSLRKERMYLEEVYVGFMNGEDYIEIIEDNDFYKKIRYLDQIYFLYIVNNSISIRKG